MNKIIGTTIFLLLLISSVSFAKDINPQQKYFQALDNVVILYSGPNAFCSGAIVQGINNRSYILTAGHCCDYMVEKQMSTKYKMGSKMYVTQPARQEDIGVDNDVCMIPTSMHHNTPLVESSDWEDVRTARLVTKFPEYPNMTSQSSIILGPWNDLPMLLTLFDFHPGMSGSPIFDKDFNIIGVVTGHILGTWRPIGIISQLAGTVWMDGQERFRWVK